MFRFLILGLLRHGDAVHGYGQKVGFRERSGINLNSGSFYHELDRLEKRGLVKKVANPSSDDPRRIPYEITDAGRGAFDAWLANPGNPVSGTSLDEMSRRALFLGDAAPELVYSVLDHWKDELLHETKIVERARRAALARDTQDAKADFTALPVLLSRKLRRIAADLEFIEDFRSTYDEWLSRNQEREKNPPPSQRLPRRRP